jgi:Fe2+ transport system protein B
MTADFIVGFTAMGCFVAALFFARFWRSTGDRFFAWFALGFAIFGANRVALGFLSEESEARPALYIVRLVAFVVILAAIAEKNRAPR